MVPGPYVNWNGIRELHLRLLLPSSNYLFLSILDVNPVQNEIGIGSRYFKVLSRTKNFQFLPPSLLSAFHSKETSSELGQAAYLLCQHFDTFSSCLKDQVLRKRKAILYWPSKIPGLFFLIIIKNLFYKEILCLQQNWGEDVEILHVPPCPQIWIAYSIVNIPHQSGHLL